MMHFSITLEKKRLIRLSGKPRSLLCKRCPEVESKYSAEKSGYISECGIFHKELQFITGPNRYTYDRPPQFIRTKECVESEKEIPEQEKGLCSSACFAVDDKFHIQLSDLDYCDGCHYIRIIAPPRIPLATMEETPIEYIPTLQPSNCYQCMLLNETLKVNPAPITNANSSYPKMLKLFRPSTCKKYETAIKKVNIPTSVRG